MAAAVKTVMTYPLNSSTVNFAIPFEYLARKFVTVTLIGETRLVLVLNQDYRFTSKTQITTTKAWGSADGYTSIEIRRYTSATDRLVDFADGSILRAYDLNISQVQTLHVAEEARDLTADTIGVNNDGNLDARGRRIVNVADAIADFDAINLRQVKQWNNSAYQSATNAKTSETKAAASATAAKTSETNAKTSETNAKASQTSAATSATNADTSEAAAAASAAAAKASQTAAATSATNAKTSETNAAASATTAKNEAAKLGNMNALAAAIESVSGTTVSFKGRLVSKGGEMGLSVQANMETNANYIEFRNTDTGSRVGYMGFGTRLDANGLSKLYLVNDTMAASTAAGVSNNAGLSDFSRTGSGSWNAQHGVEAPFFHSFSSASTSEYNPAFKQRFTSTAASWGGTWSMGTLVSSNVPVVSMQIVGSADTTGGRIWQYRTDGSTQFPGNLLLMGGAGTATYQTTGNINGNIFTSGSLAGEISTLVDYLARGSQVYSAGSGTGTGRAIEAPAGCFMTGINTNVSDGRGMGIYWRALQFRRRNGSLQNIGG